MFYKLKIMSTAKQQSPDRFNDQLLSLIQSFVFFHVSKGEITKCMRNEFAYAFIITINKQFHRKKEKNKKTEFCYQKVFRTWHENETAGWSN